MHGEADLVHRMNRLERQLRRTQRWLWSLIGMATVSGVIAWRAPHVAPEVIRARAIIIAVFFACFYTVVAPAVFFIGGESFQAQGVGLADVVLLYFGGGVGAGTVVGADLLEVACPRWLSAFSQRFPLPSVCISS